MTNVQMIEYYTLELFKALEDCNLIKIEWLEKAINNRLTLIREGKETL